MLQETLKQKGYKLSKLTFGCEALGGTDCGVVDLAELHRSVNMAWERGVRVFDTADVYGLGRSEIELASALGHKRFEATIISKFGCRWLVNDAKRRATIVRDSSPKYARAAIEQSLSRLKIDVLPIYLVHWPDEKVELNETLDALEEIKSAGLILNYGVSNFDWAQTSEAAENFDIAAIEGPCNLIEMKNLRDQYVSAQKKGIASFTYGPLAQGFLSGVYSSETSFNLNDRRHRLPQFLETGWSKYQPLLDLLKVVAEEHQKTMAQIALRWILDQNVVTSVIFGTKNRRQTELCIDTLDWCIEKSWLDQLTRQAEGLLNVS